MMGFWDKVLDIGLDIWNTHRASKIYPTLQDAVNKYRTDDYDLIECNTFAATLKKQGVFGDKTITLTVQDDGSVYISESGLLGEEKIFPKTAGAPTPDQFQQMLQEEEAQKQARALEEKEQVRMLQDGEAQNQASQALDAEEHEIRLFRMLFVMFGKIAKADSHVSQDEINVIEAFMAEMEFDQDARKIAIESFNEGKTTEVPFKEIAAEFTQYEDIENLKEILYLLVRIVAADGVLQAAEEQSLNDVATTFGLPLDFVTQALEEQGILSDLEKYYEILGCDPSVSDDELKRRYRELSLQYHPDRISAKDLAPDFQKFAKEKFQEIQNAYEIITKHRQ